MPRSCCPELGLLECAVDIITCISHPGADLASELILVVGRSGVGLGQEPVEKRRGSIPLADAVECEALLRVEPAQKPMPAESLS